MVKGTVHAVCYIYLPRLAAAASTKRLREYSIIGMASSCGASESERA